MNDSLLVVAMAAVWWVPTFVCLSDLQRKSEASTKRSPERRIRRVVFWRWTAILCVPVIGTLLYWNRGRRELEGGS